ncbi:hypothetical protein G6F68_020891 [Rhizopus microsporus]|nr:hypothetical protein G6F68_020891 [Rhizopus microsporus]
MRIRLAEGSQAHTLQGVIDAMALGLQQATRLQAQRHVATARRSARHPPASRLARVAPDPPPAATASICRNRWAPAAPRTRPA